MNAGLFAAQLNDIEAILKQLRFLLERNHFPNYKDCGAAKFKYSEYRDIWKTCYAEQFYDFILSDLSLLQFRVDFMESSYHYAYFETPQTLVTYHDYLIGGITKIV